MKKFVSLFLALVITLSMTSCGVSRASTKAYQDTETTISETTVQTEPETKAETETAKPTETETKAPETTTPPPTTAAPVTQAVKVTKAPVTTAATVTTAAATEAAAPVNDDQSVTVYITKTGEKYHRDGCQYLRKSCIPISLGDAKAEGYTPCSKCNPPQ